MKKKRIYLTAGIGMAVILAAGVSTYAYQASGSKTAETVYKETQAEYGTLTVGVSESGSVTVGTLTQDIDFEESSSASATGNQATGNSTSGGQTAGSGSASVQNSSAALYVEEVYVSAGQKVQVGDAILKLTEESVQKYKKQLTEAVEEAQANVSAAQLEAEKQKLEAGYSYDLSVAKGSVAQEEYETTLKQLQEAVDEAQEAVDTSAALINYYQEQIDTGVDLSASLVKEKENYDSWSTRLKTAQSNYTTKSIEAEKSYEETKLSYQNAGSQYSVDVSGADSSISSAQETLEDAQDALAEFESFVGNGTVYSDYEGTILELGYAAGDELSSSTSLAVFADADAVTMEVSVSQEDISEIAVGDAVLIELTAYKDQTFSGKVYGIDTSVSSGSSTVSYTVTVLFTGDIEGVFADMTGNVTFIQKQVEGVVYVSNKAIINEGTASYVKTKDDEGNIQRVQVITGFSDGMNVEIQSGLTEGETVLIESQVTAE